MPVTCVEWLPYDSDCDDPLQADGRECGEPAEYYSCDWSVPGIGKPAKPVCVKHKCRCNVKID